ncbi:hypothetical protein QJS10_CPA08g01078 [Acorus calamus]|uniref:Uncharacterized protein n=1 Tax=Acorus calamus TaxID=4465 RepID=A0AAV9EBZ5_ACOCL|nr:hypothetical protein QJS10_CPA08g01078 [Acorus calamus]
MDDADDGPLDKPDDEHEQGHRRTDFGEADDVRENVCGAVVRSVRPRSRAVDHGSIASDGREIDSSVKKRVEELKRE